MSGDFFSFCLQRIYFFNFLSHFTKRSLMRFSNHHHHRPATHLLDNWAAHKLFHFTSHTTRGANFSLSHFFFSINSTRLCVVLCSLFSSYHVKAHHQQLSIIRTEKQIWVFSDEKFFLPSSQARFTLFKEWNRCVGRRVGKMYENSQTFSDTFYASKNVSRWIRKISLRRRLFLQFILKIEKKERKAKWRDFHAWVH